MKSCRTICCVVLFGGLTGFGCTKRPLAVEQPRRSANDAPDIDLKAPERFGVRLDTSKGAILLDIHRDWAPHGADRFYNLVRVGYFDQSRFFRVIRGKWRNSALTVTPAYQTPGARTIPDDPPRKSNVRGTIAFAFAVPNGRATQLFINLRNNSATHDREPFVPIGRVVDGMEVADALFADYGESAGGGIRANKQQPLFDEGNSYLNRSFPRLDFIRDAKLVSH